MRITTAITMSGKKINPSTIWIQRCPKITDGLLVRWSQANFGTGLTRDLVISPPTPRPPTPISPRMWWNRDPSSGLGISIASLGTFCSRSSLWQSLIWGPSNRGGFCGHNGC